jgi:hypothetical protein
MHDALALDKRGFIVADVPLAGEQTIYVRFGEWVALPALVLMLILSLVGFNEPGMKRWIKVVASVFAIPTLLIGLLAVMFGEGISEAGDTQLTLTAIWGYVLCATALKSARRPLLITAAIGVASLVAVAAL